MQGCSYVYMHCISGNEYIQYIACNIACNVPCDDKMRSRSVILA